MPFRGTSVVHPWHPCVGEPIPMRKPPTGEPCAGESHARFGGRGRREPFPTPIGLWKDANSTWPGSIENNVRTHLSTVDRLEKILLVGRHRRIFLVIAGPVLNTGFGHPV